MRKKVMLLMVAAVMVLVPIAVFAASSNGDMMNCEEFARSVFEERLRQSGIQPSMTRNDTSPISYDCEESLRALERFLELKNRQDASETTCLECDGYCDHITAEPLSPLCIIAHNWGAWSLWFAWGEVFHSVSCINGNRPSTCVRDEAKMRECLRCNNGWQYETRYGQRFSCWG